jgi:hypothetical protein
VVPRLFRLCLISTRLLTFLILILIDFRTLPKNYLPFDTTTIKVGIVMRYIDWLTRSSSDATSAVTEKNLYDSVRMTMVSDLQHIMPERLQRMSTYLDHRFCQSRQEVDW